eukprot:scaffold2143_cov125-Cylindrotheca_fusiformis.AAC.21
MIDHDTTDLNEEDNGTRVRRSDRSGQRRPRNRYSKDRDAKDRLMNGTTPAEIQPGAVSATPGTVRPSRGMDNEDLVRKDDNGNRNNDDVDGSGRTTRSRDDDDKMMKSKRRRSPRSNSSSTTPGAQACSPSSGNTREKRKGKAAPLLLAPGVHEANGSVSEQSAAAPAVDATTPVAAIPVDEDEDNERVRKLEENNQELQRRIEELANPPASATVVVATPDTQDDQDKVEDEERRRKKKKGYFCLAVVLLAIIGGVIGFFLSRDDGSDSPSSALAAPVPAAPTESPSYDPLNSLECALIELGSPVPNQSIMVEIKIQLVFDVTLVAETPEDEWIDQLVISLQVYLMPALAGCPTDLVDQDVFAGSDLTPNSIGNGIVSTSTKEGKPCPGGTNELPASCTQIPVDATLFLKGENQGPSAVIGHTLEIVDLLADSSVGLGDSIGLNPATFKNLEFVDIQSTQHSIAPTTSPTSTSSTEGDTLQPSSTTESNNPTPDVFVPTRQPTEIPIAATSSPTKLPTLNPTSAPLPPPTSVPVPELTPDPTPPPTQDPTPSPTQDPTPPPTPDPTSPPTPDPTSPPTPDPTSPPTRDPTRRPTRDPTPQPTSKPTKEPTPNPTPAPLSYTNPTPFPKPTFPIQAPFRTFKPVPLASP